MITMSDLCRVSVRQVVRQRGFGVILSIALGITAFIALSVLGQEIRYKVGQDMVLMGGVNIIRVYMDAGRIKVTAGTGRGYVYISSASLPEASRGTVETLGEGRYRLWVDTKDEVMITYTPN